MRQLWKMESMDCHETWPFLCCQSCWKRWRFGVKCNVYAACTSWDITSYKIQNAFCIWRVKFGSAGVLNKSTSVALYVLYRLCLAHGWIISLLWLGWLKIHWSVYKQGCVAGFCCVLPLCLSLPMSTSILLMMYCIMSHDFIISTQTRRIRCHYLTCNGRQIIQAEMRNPRLA